MQILLPTAWTAFIEKHIPIKCNDKKGKDPKLVLSIGLCNFLSSRVQDCSLTRAFQGAVSIFAELQRLK